MRYDDVAERERTKGELVYEFVRSRFLSIVAVVLLGLILAAIVGFSIEVPRWAKIGGLTMLILSPFAVLVGSLITSLLPDPPGVVLVDVDARVMDSAVYWFPVDTFRESLEVTKGELNQVAPSLYFGKQIDREELTVEGTWRGTVSDRELIRGLAKVHECRGQLEDDARKGFIIETQAFTLVRSAARDATQTIVETFQKGTLPDEGDGINDAIDSALEEYGIEEQLKDELEDVDDLDLDADLLDPDGDLDQQAEQRVAERSDAADAHRAARQEASGDA
jgi:hypothetical protein